MNGMKHTKMTVVNEVRKSQPKGQNYKEILSYT